jgi:diguanylate cyclase (GGDEF)-like protein
MHEAPTLTLGRSEVSLYQSLDSNTRPCLIRYSGAAVGQRFDLDKGQVVLGRGDEVDLKVEGHGISRRHATLQVSAHEVTLSDLGSANASFVNDQRVTDPVVLKDGDLIRLANVVFRYHDQRSLDAVLHQRLHRLATVDALTDLYNRRHTHDALRHEWHRARRTGRALAVMCCDLDQFKAVNDSLGHAAGDRVLKDSASLLRASLRADDVIGRWGGEEFVVVAGDTPFEQALLLAERLRSALADHLFELDVGEPGRVRRQLHRQTVSIGLALAQPDMRDEHDLLATADRRLYAAKREGRNRVVAVDPQQR